MPEKKQILFIVGCQRSGTTMLSRIFERDLNTKSYGEAGAVSQLDARARLRLRPFDEVHAEIERARASLIVMKPLVESQNTTRLLDAFPGSKAVWIYRHFRDVAASNLVKFGSGNSIKDLRIIAENIEGDWRTEFVASDVRDLIRANYSPEMDAADAAVLFWIARNRLFFDLALQNDERIYLCKYEALTTDPVRIMNAIYAFGDHAYPSSNITAGTHSDSISKGADLSLAPLIENAALEVQTRLDEIWNGRNEALT